MDENRKSQSPIAWVLGQTGDHGGQYVLSVILAVIGVAFSVAPYFVVVGICGWEGSCSTPFPLRLVTERLLPCWARSVRGVRRSWPACRWALS